MRSDLRTRWHRLLRPVSGGQWVVDGVTAGFFALFAVALLPVYYDGFSLAANLVTVVVMVAALLLSRVSPPLSLAVAWIGAFFQMATGQGPMAANLAIFVVLFATAAYGSRLVFWLGFASTFAGSVCVAVYLLFVAPSAGIDFFSFGVVDGSSPLQVVFYLVLVFGSMLFSLLLAWTLGALFRVVLRGRETRRAQVQAEERAAAEEERSRIARDMHDIVAHSLAVVIAQADGARYAARADPDAATAALSTISQTARSALSDVRMLLTQMRHRQGEGPQPTIADLEQLYAHVRAAGVDLRVTVDPAPQGEPPAAVQLAVYRILQEATTNALRHGDGGPVDVVLAWLPGSVALSVRNAVRPAASSADTGKLLHAAPASGGHGLVGMRERAELAGGRLDAGPHGAHWLVQATLPVETGTP
ncbi:sensor histidine kinase [Microbacterium gilvum]|uniref:histidine kinase n=1 Tax=Microbacterium gilvum TaxID=1336204 RepID=A0ABP9AC01_9MICO